MCHIALLECNLYFNFAIHNLEFYHHVFSSLFIAPKTPMVLVTLLIGDSVVEVQAEWPKLVSILFVYLAFISHHMHWQTSEKIYYSYAEREPLL